MSSITGTKVQTRYVIQRGNNFLNFESEGQQYRIVWSPDLGKAFLFETGNSAGNLMAGLVRQNHNLRGASISRVELTTTLLLK